MKSSSRCLIVVLALCAFATCRGYTAPTLIDDRHNLLWVAPNNGSDILDMFQHPELWSFVLSQTDVFKFYDYQTARSGFCTFCGENMADNFLSVVPGGAFRWLNNKGIKIALESASIKPFNCGGPPTNTLATTLDAIATIEASGARVSYVALDEPFAYGLDPQHDFARGSPKCGYTKGQAAEYAAYSILGIKSRYPWVQVGLIEPYAYFTAEEIMDFIVILENLGVKPAFFHLDYDPAYAVDQVGDISLLRQFFWDRRIAFGILLVGDDGTSPEAPLSGALSLAIRINNSIPLASLEHIVVQSFLEDPTTGLRLYPQNIPETEPETLTGFAYQVLKMLGR